MTDECLVPHVDCAKPKWEYRSHRFPAELVPSNEEASAKFLYWCGHGTASVLVTNPVMSYMKAFPQSKLYAVPWDDDLWIYFTPQANPKEPFYIISYSQT